MDKNQTCHDKIEAIIDQFGELILDIILSSLKEINGGYPYTQAGQIKDETFAEMKF